MPQLESLLQRLIHQRVDFVIVGGFAAVAHGVTLVTQDLDIAMPFASENLRRLQSALKDLSPVYRLTPARLPFEMSETNVATLKNLYLDTELGAIDCLGEVKGLGAYDEVVRCSEEIILPAGACRILTIEALIRAKQAMGRSHDQLTILQLRAIKERRDQA